MSLPLCFASILDIATNADCLQLVPAPHRGVAHVMYTEINITVNTQLL